MSFFDLPIMSALATRMSYDSERQVVLSQNIANIDTPGYIPKDLEPLQFKDMLVGGASRLQMTPATSGTNITQVSGVSTSYGIIDQTQGLENKPIGNSVNIEEQMLRMAQNQTDYQMATGLFQKLGDLIKNSFGKT